MRVVIKLNLESIKGKWKCESNVPNDRKCEVKIVDGKPFDVKARDQRIR